MDNSAQESVGPRLDGAIDAGPIDAAMLERLGRIARGFPGRTISLEKQASHSLSADSAILERWPVIRIDGVEAADFLSHYERD